MPIIRSASRESIGIILPAPIATSHFYAGGSNELVVAAVDAGTRASLSGGMILGGSSTSHDQYRSGLQVITDCVCVYEDASRKL